MLESFVLKANDPFQVVVIEDDLALNALICKTLEKISFPALGYYSGDEALRYARESQSVHDLFLIDFHLEDMSGEQLVRSLQEVRKDTPFIIMTGYGDEKIAVDMMKMGALDYLIKDHNFIGLLPSTMVQAMNHLKVQRQLAESQIALQKSEQKYRLLAENSSDIISRFSWDKTFLYVSAACKKMLGYEPEELIGKSVYYLVHPDDMETVGSNHDEMIRKQCPSLIQCYRIRKKGGDYIWVETNSQVLINPDTGLVEEIVGVTRDISERREKEELLKAKEVAEHSDKAKSAFLANLSHEIRNPMNAIIGMANTLSKTLVDEQQLSYLNSILFSSKNLLNILNDILDFSKIEARRVSLTYSTFDIREMIGDLEKGFRPQAADRGLAFEVSFGREIPDEIYGDEQKINQVLNNLLSNAIKFTKTGTVTLTVGLAKGSPDMLQFGVEDSGIGVRSEQIPHLFDSFRQLDISPRKEYQGTGLGLSIVKSLAELMNGHVRFESEFGKGSLVTFEVPLMGSGPENDAPREGGTFRQEGGYQRNLKILIAEDEAINQVYLAGFLRSKGWEADTASNGILVLEKYINGTYDLILMDGQMPKMDGFEATRKIRDMERDTGKHTPIIAITGYAIPGDRERFLKAGMDDYISKPIDEEKLLAAIQRLTG
jgi:PAS domain S-box-containing protein